MSGKDSSWALQPHDFKDRTYHSVTMCNFCGDVMWGFSSQGLQCTSCTFNTHKSCAAKVLGCHIRSAQAQGVAHNFLETSFKRPTYCNLCRGLLHGIVHQGLKCDVCKYVTHVECSKKVPRCCRVGFVTSPSNDLQIGHHHWVEGNCSSRLVCVVCAKSCTAVILAHYSCSWCKVCVHSTCLSSFHQVCDFGNMSSLIPPHCVLKVDDQYELLPAQLPSKPLIVFVNPKSGGQQGQTLLRRLRYLLNDDVQVYSLIPDGPGKGLAVIRKFVQRRVVQQGGFDSSSSPPLPPPTDLRILVCGGDGTAGWILQVS
jgi:diacylglycerol kinase (ATP)